MRWRSPIVTLVRRSVPLHRLLIFAATITARVHLMAQIFLAPVVRRRLVLHLSLPPHLSKYHRCEVYCADDRCDHCVGYDGCLLRIGKSQSKTTVDDTKEDSNTANS